jgi:hypothetical protein
MADNFDWSSAPPPVSRSGARPSEPTTFDWSTAEPPVLRSTGRSITGEAPLPLPPQQMEPPRTFQRPMPAEFSQSPFVTPEINPKPVENVIQQEPFAGGEGAFDQVVTNPNIARQAARARGVQATRPEPPKFEDLPTLIDLPETQDPRNLALFAGLPFASTAEGRQNIVTSNLPGATSGTDIYGNPIVEYQGQRYHVDRPDKINMQDVTYGAFSMAPSMISSGLIGGMTKMLPRALQIAGQAIGGGGANISRQAGARAAGSEEDFAAGPAILEAALSGALQGAQPRPSTPAYGQVDPATRRYLETMNRRFRLGADLSPEEALIDRPVGAQIAQQYGATSRSGQEFLDSVNTALTDRAVARQARIGAAVDDAFGPLDKTTRTFVQDMARDKKQLSQDLTVALSNAGPMDVTPVIQRIDALKASLPENSSAVPFYDRMRSLLQEGGQSISDPRKLQIALDEIDDLIRFGGNYTTTSGQTASLAPRPSRDFASREIRTELSNILKQDPEYARIMGGYRDFYGTKEAFEAGQKLFSRDMVPELAEAWLNNPATTDAFKLGARNSVRMELGRNADELRNLSRTAGAEGSIQNQVLRRIYGDDSIDSIANFANLESRLRRTEQVVPANIEAQLAASIAEEGTRRATRGLFDTSNVPIPFVTPALQLLQKYTMEPLNRIPRSFSGFDRPETARGLANVLTMPGERGTEILRGVERSAQRPPISRGAAPLSSQPGRETEEGIIPWYERRAGGRVGRASGGRLVRNDHAARAAALIRAADAAKKAHNKTTEGILEQPDETVAKALSIANQAI